MAKKRNNVGVEIFIIILLWTLRINNTILYIYTVKIVISILCLHKTLKIGYNFFMGYHEKICINSVFDPDN